MPLFNGSDMILIADGRVCLRGQVFPRLPGMYLDGFEGDDLHFDGSERQEPEEVFQKGRSSIVEDEVAILRRKVLVVHADVANTDRDDISLCQDSGIKQGVLEWLHAVAVRRGSFGKERDGQALAEREGNVPDLALQPRRSSSLYKNTSAEPGQRTEQRGVLQLNGGDEHRGCERGNDKDIDIGKMIRDDEASVYGFVKAFAMFHANVDPEQDENNSGKARGGPYCNNTFCFPINGEQADDS